MYVIQVIHVMQVINVIELLQEIQILKEITDTHQHCTRNTGELDS